MYMRVLEEKESIEIEEQKPPEKHKAMKEQQGQGNHDYYLAKGVRFEQRECAVKILIVRSLDFSARVIFFACDWLRTG